MIEGREMLARGDNRVPVVPGSPSRHPARHLSPARAVLSMVRQASHFLHSLLLTTARVAVGDVLWCRWAPAVSSGNPSWFGLCWTAVHMLHCSSFSRRLPESAAATPVSFDGDDGDTLQVETGGPPYQART